VRSCGRAACAKQGEATCPLGVPGTLFGMYGIAMPPRGARALLQRLFPVSMQVDTELSRLYQHLGKVSGDLNTRVFSSERSAFAPLRVFAPRCPPLEGGNSNRFPAWPGPLVVAPASRADCTDIQVLSGENYAQQYPGSVQS
ncbi:unnamed protein product, partial [Polarella glacialis]